MTDAGEDRLEHRTAAIRPSADRGRWTPLLWGAGLMLVVAVAVAGQRPPAIAPSAAIASPTVAADVEIAAANATPDLSSLPWDTSRRWAGDLVVRRGAPPWLDRPFGVAFVRVRDRLTSPLAR